ncbi:G3ST1-like protein [Mya arenaria]|uniref:G3ST1-like protein n=1 Tax=Mya arenaria TaxID=6604 RepID=A0ABY7EPC2_MYAAR|nr:G3ST1-like protein [Mya arenaria]
MAGINTNVRKRKLCIGWLVCSGLVTVFMLAHQTSLPSSHGATAATTIKHLWHSPASHSVNATDWIASPHATQEVRHIGFLKVHKAASSTMQNIFFRFGMKRNLTFVFTDHPNYFSRTASHHLPVVTPRLRGGHDILCTHGVFNIRTYGSVLPVDAKYIAIVREPLQQFVSSVNYYSQPAQQLSYLSAIRGNRVTELIRNPKYDPGFFSYTKNTMARDFGFPGTTALKKRFWRQFRSESSDIHQEVLHFKSVLERLAAFCRAEGGVNKGLLEIEASVWGAGISVSSDDCQLMVKEELDFISLLRRIQGSELGRRKAVPIQKDLCKKGLPSKSVPVSSLRFEISVIPPSGTGLSSELMPRAEMRVTPPPLSLSPPLPNLKGRRGVDEEGWDRGFNSSPRSDRQTDGHALSCHDTGKAGASSSEDEEDDELEPEDFLLESDPCLGDRLDDDEEDEEELDDSISFTIDVNMWETISSARFSTFSLSTELAEDRLDDDEEDEEELDEIRMIKPPASLK